MASLPKSQKIISTSLSLSPVVNGSLCLYIQYVKTYASHVCCLCLSPPAVICITNACASAESGCCAWANKEYFRDNINPGQTFACFSHLSLTFRMTVVALAFFRHSQHWLVKRPLLQGPGIRSSPVVSFISRANLSCAFRCFVVSDRAVPSLRCVESSVAEDSCSVAVKAAISMVFSKGSVMLLLPFTATREKKLRILLPLSIASEEQQRKKAEEA